MKMEMFEEKLARKLRESVAGKSLPCDFADRLALSMRRSAIHRRAKTVVVAALAAVVALAAVFVGCHGDMLAKRDPAIVADDSPFARSVVKEWLFFGCVREWCRRVRNARKRKDESDDSDSSDS